ncbi:rho-N domain-containing protein 1, chloroplastic-like isoform X2 [Momordica charantia]|uniref:Rho-N domain-containing protein 1, chloroplastic-like isoform X2 n=1 Tax=Momordica charantia TaxID=3673 RepID=A0A6J1DQX2_MOMCH|nr:rho-N domain-containing protein 1, chloroplastic-like isoform X2 [Momordica charantia]
MNPAMSQATYLLPNNVTDGRCVPCSGVSGRAAPVSSRSLYVEHRINAQVKFPTLNCTSLGASFTCNATSGGHRRNPDFSKQNRHGFSRGRNRQNEERDGLENLEESDLLSSKNGPLLSLSSSTPKSQATATPGPREKEIVELFREVQAQLRERAAMKEEKKMEAQGHTKGSETVDSLLKLLRKHSVEQGKRSSGSSSSGGKDFSFNQVKENDPYDEGKGTSIFGLSANLREKTQEPTRSSFSRPISNFQRKSPVPRVKYQPIYPGEDSIVESTAGVNSRGLKFNGIETGSEMKSKVWAREESKRESWKELQPQRETGPGPDPDPEFELEPEPESYELEHEPDEMEPELVNLLTVSSDVNDTFDDDVKDNENFEKHEDLNSLKLAELRAIAKSRGLKRFSKIRKSELVQLLSEAQE